MKKIITLLITALLTILSSLTIYKNSFNKTSEDKPSNKTNENNTKEPVPDFITKTLTEMTLEEKIAQMFIVDYRKPTMDNNLKNILAIKPGGFIFFKENLVNYNDSLTLIKNIKDTATIPMFLSIDEEGGRVDRLKTINGITFNETVSAYDIGATNNANIAYNKAAEIANNLNIFGFNMNFAPVLDVFSNPKNTVIGTRSFGSDPYLVSKMGLSFAKGLNDNNIISVYKHFPGHGNTETDSHVDLPIVTKTKEELLNEELIPFKDAINANADVIMIGHLAVPSITNDYSPASLSKTLITDFLKNELGYNNLVITDALNMKALTKNYTKDEIIINAINAGVDILLMPEDPILAVNTIKNAIETNKISINTINNSVRKILNLKLKYNIIKK